MAKIEINKEQFDAFESVRESGMTNMFDRTKTIELSGGVLDKDSYTAIVKHYDKLRKQFK